MSKKKKEIIPDELGVSDHLNVDGEEDQCAEVHTQLPNDQIYLVDTLISMNEISKYGLNKYFLRAILDKKFYTLEEAEKAIREAIEGK